MCERDVATWNCKDVWEWRNIKCKLYTGYLFNTKYFLQNVSTQYIYSGITLEKTLFLKGKLANSEIRAVLIITTTLQGR